MRTGTLSLKVGVANTQNSVLSKNTYSLAIFKHLTPNGHYMGRTAQLTSKCCILYIYSTNIRTEYFKRAA